MAAQEALRLRQQLSVQPLRKKLVTRPPLLPRPPARVAIVPSIPVADRAWGYEEDQTSGLLTLQQPEAEPGSPRGPGAYSPTAYTLPCAPHVDFSHCCGREDAYPAQSGRQYQELLGSVDAPSEPVPVAPRPLPIAEMRQRARRPPKTHRPLQPPLPSPGPGAFESPRGLGDTGQVWAMPPQTRHYTPRSPRGLVHLQPLTPESARSLRAPDVLSVRACPLKALTPHEPSSVVAHDAPDSSVGGASSSAHVSTRASTCASACAVTRASTGISAYSSSHASSRASSRAGHGHASSCAAARAAARTTPRADLRATAGATFSATAGPTEGATDAVANGADGALAHAPWLGSSPTRVVTPPEALPGEPPGLSPLERRLWSSFSAADEDSDGSLSREEFMSALHRAGLHTVLGKRGMKEAWSYGDKNQDGVMEWNEFVRLSRSIPAISDFMHHAGWDGVIVEDGPPDWS